VEPAVDVMRHDTDKHIAILEFVENTPLNHRSAPRTVACPRRQPAMTVDGERSQDSKLTSSRAHDSSDPPPARLPQRSAVCGLLVNALHGSRQCIARSFSEWTPCASPTG